MYITYLNFALEKSAQNYSNDCKQNIFSVQNPLQYRYQYSKALAHIYRNINVQHTSLLLHAKSQIC